MDDLMAELKQQRIWFCWVWKQTQNGKPSKKPIASTGGPTGTSENWSHTWVTYEEAMAAVETIHAPCVLAQRQKRWPIARAGSGIWTDRRCDP